MTQDIKTSQIAARAQQLAIWLEEQAPYAQFDQRHLDSGTPEQAYWHLGYAAALKDVISLLNVDDEGRRDTPNRFPSADRDA